MKRIWPRPRIRPLQQMEATECGCACLAMVAAYYGNHTPLPELRQVCGTSRDGNSALDLMRGARSLGLHARGLSVELPGLRKLRRPAILHWDMNHFVVLEAVGKHSVTIVDPASGRRKVGPDELNRMFSGVALELTLTKSLTRRAPTSRSYTRYRAALGKARSVLLFVLVARVAIQLFGLVSPAASQVVIDHLITPRRAEWLVPVLGMMLLSATGQIFLSKLQGSSQALLHSTLGLELTTELGRRLLSVPLPFLDSRGHGDLIGRVRLQSELQGLVAQTTEAVFQFVFVLLLGSLMLAYDWKLGLVAFAMMALRIVVIRRAREASQQRLASELAARGREQAALAEAATCPEMIRGLGAGERILARYEGRMTERAQFGLRSERLQQGLVSSLSVLGGAMEAMVLWYGGSRVISGEMTLGVFAGFLAIRTILEPPLASLVSLFEGWLQFRNVLDRSDDVLSVQPVGSGTEDASRISGRIEVKNLGFRYGSGGNWVFRNVSLTIEPGQRVTFVGPSGHGKSTLGKLLCGLLEPTEGEVCLDGVAIGSFDRVSLAQRFGVVLQEPLILEGTASEAIALRMPDAGGDAIREAARKACFDEVVQRLPGAYDGRVLALGANLSGGERQRLAVAQALLGTPSVLLLDEATSALDLETEGRVLDAVEYGSCTLLTIAHRGSVVARADRVFVVLNGQVAEAPPASVIGRARQRANASAGHSRAHASGSERAS